MINRDPASTPDADSLIATIRGAFADNQFPGNPFLLGSFDGTEGQEVVSNFYNCHDWSALDAAFLDSHYTSLSFFSEAGFRYFLPAYLVADIRGELDTADPEFHLTYGFADGITRVELNGRMFARAWGRTRLINPRRYGAATTEDYRRYRLSIFAREEAEAIRRYLEWRLGPAVEPNLNAAIVNAALALYWNHRASNAPTKAMLASHLHEEAEYVSALLASNERGGPQSEESTL